jgi:hypothetical protein
MRYRNRELAKDIAKTVGLFATLIGVVAFCMWWFPRADCSSALKNLEFFEKCEQHDGCMLHPDEERKVRIYTRMMLESCPADRLPKE